MTPIEIVEVGPRDGLQSEGRVLSTEVKLALIRRLVVAGLKRIEVASFVHPLRVPQMADAEAVIAGLARYEDVSAIGLVLNRRGLDRALATRVNEVNFVVYASEGYSRHNANADVEEVMTAVLAMLPRANAAGRRTSVTISVAFGDPFDGEVPAERVARLAGRLAAAGAGEIALGDTIGAAVPADVEERISLLRKAAPGVPLRCHFHNTRNTAVANAAVALQIGVEALDTSVGGYGGSPFAPGAGGNLPTEDLAYLLRRSGVVHGLAEDDLVDTAGWLAAKLGTPVKAMLGEAGRFPPGSAA